MNRLKKMLFYMGLLISLGYHPCMAFAKLEIVVESPTLSKYPIAIPDLENISPDQANTDMALRWAIAKVIRDDLNLSGYFDIIDKNRYLIVKNAGITKETINFAPWRLMKADALIRGGYRIEKDQFTLELRLFDVFLGQSYLERVYSGKQDEWRRFAHQFTNEIIEKITGERGIFDTRIVFQRKDQIKGVQELYTIDIDGYYLKQITHNGGINMLPSWSPDGNRIIFTSLIDKKSQINMISLLDQTTKTFFSSKGLNISPFWSPDGQWIAFASSKDGDPEIYIKSANGDQMRQLTEDWGIDVDPSWSPDGKKIVFSSNRSDENHIYKVSLTDSQVERLTFTGWNNQSPVWSPKGDKIAFSSYYNDFFQLFTMDENGNNIEQLTFANVDSEHPSWSPDGRFIVFHARQGKRDSLFILNVRTREVTQLTSGEGNDVNPAWSPRLIVPQSNTLGGK